MDDSEMAKYQGKRALILTRVSTPKQAEKYSHAAQERQVREKLIAPLLLRIVDEKRHIIRDTYSGLEYRFRKALDDILTMAERGEFDILCMDVLDRGLGRRALARELFRMQLKELGISILTTQPSDHADDDSLEGQIMRFFKGVKAEEEINDLVRRSRDGKREKALGDETKDVPRKVVGSGDPLYGYAFVCDEKGKHIGYTTKLDVIYTEADGTQWTEVTVVLFIFESAADGISLHRICEILTAKGIPTPHTTKGKKRHRNMVDEPVWQQNTVRKILHNTAYYGRYVQFKRTVTGKVPGHKAPATRPTTEEEQVIIPVPSLVTQELYEKANWRIKANKQLATRNNQTAKATLLRGGFARCVNCGGSLHASRIWHTLASGEKKPDWC